MTTESTETPPAMPDFSYPMVKNAYQPSGKITVRAVLFMVAAGAVGGVLVGGLVILADQVISAIGRFAVSMGEWPGLIIMALGFVAYVVVGILLGSLLGRLMSRGGRLGKNRNAAFATMLAFLAGMMALVLFYILRSQELGEAAFDTVVDWLKFGLYSIGILTASGVVARERVLNDKFCEECSRYMEKAPEITIDINQEASVMDALATRRFATLPPLDTGPHEDSRCSVSLDYCSGCRAVGFLSMTTHLVARRVDDDGNEKVLRQIQQGFSREVDGEEIAALQAVGTGPETPPTKAGLEPIPNGPPERVADRSFMASAPSCWTCDVRPADTTTAVALACPSGLGHAGQIDTLRAAGYVRGQSVLVPRCRACLGAARQIGIAGQVAAWVGIPVGIGVASLVYAALESTWPSMLVGLAAFLGFAFLLMRHVRRTGPKDANTRPVLEHPAILVAHEAGWTGGSMPLIAKFGPRPSNTVDVELLTTNAPT